tara:strand:- start:20833 stop:21756 length:924 start_codon:yes stop_codon:yes gene_type:complete
MVLGFLSVNQPVIAAVTTNDQGAIAQVSDSGSSWLSIWMIPIAVLALVIFIQIPNWRLKKPRIFKPAFSSTSGLVLFVAALMGGLLGTQIAMQIGSPRLEGGEYDLSSTLPLMIGSYIGQGVVFLLVPGLVLGRGRIQWNSRPMSWFRAVLAGCLGMIIALPMTLAVAQVAGAVLEWSTGQTFNEIGHGTLVQIKEAAADPDLVLVLIVFMVIVVTPIWEEILYRGLLQESIGSHPLTEGESPWVSIVITSLIFATMHGAMVDLRGLAALFVLSLGFGWIYVRTGRLIASIVMHAAFNAFNILVVIL